MSYLRNLPEQSALLDVFRQYPATARPLIQFHQALMRGPSPLTAGERELIAAFVSGLNACAYCHGIHAVTAQAFGVKPELLEELLNDLDHAPIQDRLRSLLRYVRLLTLQPNRASERDVRAVFAAGWTDQALHDAVAICALFNLMNRLVSGLGIDTDNDYLRLAGERLALEGYAGLLNKLPTEGEVQDR